MKSSIQQENKLVENSPQSESSPAHKGSVYSTITDRVAAIRKESGKGMACDAGFAN